MMILNIITETIRLKENMGEISMKIGHGNEFLDLTKKAKINKWNYVKPKGSV